MSILTAHPVCQYTQSTLSAKIVGHLFLKAFSIQAAYLMDWASILAANETFYATYVFDARCGNLGCKVWSVACGACKACSPTGSMHPRAPVMLGGGVSPAAYMAHLQGTACKQTLDPKP